MAGRILRTEARRAFQDAAPGTVLSLFNGRQVRVIETLVPRDSSQLLPDSTRVWLSGLTNASY